MNKKRLQEIMLKNLDCFDDLDEEKVNSATEDELWLILLSNVKREYDPKTAQWDLLDIYIEDMGITTDEFMCIKRKLPELFFVSENGNEVTVKIEYKNMDDRVICNTFGSDNRVKPSSVEVLLNEKKYLFSWLNKYGKKVSIVEPAEWVSEYDEFKKKYEAVSKEKDAIDIARVKKLASNAIKNSDYKPITKEAKKLAKLPKDKLWDIVITFVIDSIERCDMEVDEIFDVLLATEEEKNMIMDLLPEYFG